MNISNYLENFLNSELSFQGKPYPIAEIEETVSSLRIILSDIHDHTECYLHEKNPLNFSLLFFLLLEKNCSPIPLPSDLSTSFLNLINAQTNRAFIFNGEIKNKGIAINKKENIDPYYICMTSGSTGNPKECILTLSGAIENAKEHALSLGITSKHNLLQNLPLYHSFGIVAYLFVTAIYKCALEFSPIFLTPKNMKKRSWKNCVLHCSPAQLNFMLKEKDIAVAGVSIVSFGAGVVSSANVLQLKSTFPDARLFVTYGLTELGPRVTTGEITQEMDTGYIGVPFSNIKAKVFNEEHGLSKTGEGLLALQSPSLKRNCTSIEVVLDGESTFYLTQDFVRITPSGEIYFLSRSDDLIKVGGISVYAIDIEETTKRFYGVLDCIVLPMPHNMYGDVPALFVEGQVDLRELEKYLSSELTTYQMPKKVFILEKLPRISLNKVDRKKLKAEYFG